MKTVLMSIADYKNTIKSMVDSTQNKELLMQWKEQLEWDIKNKGEAELSDEEWRDVQEGLEDYKNGNFISFDEFLKKR